MSRRRAAYDLGDIGALSAAGLPVSVAGFEYFRKKLRAHVLKRYGWMQNFCPHMNADDLVQIANLALFELCRDWSEIAEARDVSSDPVDNPGMFWKYLAFRVKDEVRMYAKTNEGTLNEDGHWIWTRSLSLDAEDEHFATSGLVREDIRDEVMIRDHPPYLSRNAVVDLFSILPTRDKIYLALRFFDGLSLKDAGQLVGSSPTAFSMLVERARSHVRGYARHQYSTTDAGTGDLRPRKGAPWDIPGTLHDYLRTRHDLDVHEWLGLFTISMRVDVSYLIDIVSGRGFMPDTASRRGLTPEQESELGRRIAENQPSDEIMSQMGISYELVRYHRKTKRGQSRERATHSLRTAFNLG